MEENSLFGPDWPNSKQETNSNKLKKKLDYLYELYCTPEFILSDPIQFVYRFSEERDKEVAGFIASVMSQGKREKIISKTEELLFNVMKGTPYEYTINFDIDSLPDKLRNFSYFAYRNILGEEIGYVIYSVGKVLRRWGSLKNLFYEAYQNNKGSKNVREILIYVVDKMLGWNNSLSSAIYSLIPTPKRGSACKRLNMFLRWMVRKDRVDTGLWSDVIPTSLLVIPLDFHVLRVSREFGLTKRNQNDWLTAEEITEKLKEFDPMDPVKYDFAIFGYGVTRKDINS